MKIKKTNLLFIWLFCLGIACRVGAAEDSDDKLERESLRKIQMRKASTTAEAAISEYKRYMREFSSRVNQISSVAILKQDLEGASLEDKNLLLLRYSMLGKLPMVKCLVKSNADVNVNNEDGWSPLTLAARFGRQKIAQYIVQNNADVNREGYRKRTPLMEAAIKDYKVLTHIFVDSKADLSRKDENNITALELAIKLRCFDSAAILLVAQEEFFTKKAKKNKSTRLMCAAREGDYYMVTQYFDEDNIDSIDKRGFTALMKAAQYGHLRVVNFLIDSRADIFKVNEYGTALTLAVQSGYSDVVSLLLKKNAEVNAENSEAGTSLILAARKGYFEIVKMLLASGADSNKVDKFGWSALTMATYNEHVDIVVLLLEQDPSDYFVKKALKKAKRKKNNAMIELLNGVINKRRELVIDI